MDMEIEVLMKINKMMFYHLCVRLYNLIIIIIIFLVYKFI